MYYITKINERYVWVKDTTDNAVDKFSKYDILSIEKHGFKIHGIFHYLGKIYFSAYSDVSAKLLTTTIGTPIRVKISSGLDYKQTLYLGSQFKDGKEIFMFFDDSGVDGYFGLSAQYLYSNDGFDLDFNNNDPQRVATLTRRLKDSGGF